MSATPPRFVRFKGATYELHQAATISDEEREFLDDLVQMQAQSEGRENWKEFKADSAVIQQYEAFRAQLEQALALYPNMHLSEGTTLADLTEEEGIYLVLMTLRGEGVGIWDGRWDQFFQNPADIKELESYLKHKLGGFADDTGSGSLNNAIMDAAYLQATAQEDE